MPKRLKVATRASRLALLQTHIVTDALRAHGVECELVTISTTGDRVQDRSLAAIGGDGVFVKELEYALLDGRADVAVHSMKDVPSDLLAGAQAGAILERGDPRDVLLSKDRAHAGLHALPRGAKVGTSSLRRRAQLAAARDDLEIVDMRGNVDTRIRKLLQGEYDAIVLAYAGVLRLNAHAAAATPLAAREVVPAVGQGALFAQCRTSDEETRAALAPLQHAPSALAVTMERAFLKRMGGGCLVPIGAYLELCNGAWRFDAFVGSADGSRVMRRSQVGRAVNAAEAIAVVEQIADEMLAAGAREIVAGF